MAKLSQIILAWRQQDGMHCTVTQFPWQPVTTATRGGRELFAGEEGGGEDRKGTGKIHPRRTNV